MTYSIRLAMATTFLLLLQAPATAADLSRQLYKAVDKGDEAKVRTLLSQGADPSRGKGEWPAPLFAATRKCHQTIARLLLDAGADMNIQDRGNSEQTPVSLASGRCLPLVKEFLARGAEPIGPPNTLEMMLYLAVEAGLVEPARKLVEQGVSAAIPSVRAEVPRYRPPMIYAAWEGKADMVKGLLDAGADANIRFEGFTPLLIAARNSHVEVVKVLLESGKARVNARYMAELLYSSGSLQTGRSSIAQAEIREEGGYGTPLKLAKDALRIGHPSAQQIVDLLIKYGGVE